MLYVFREAVKRELQIPSVEYKSMLKSFRYRLYPNHIQQANIRKTIDACRFVYNWALETKKLPSKRMKPILAGMI